MLPENLSINYIEAELSRIESKSIKIQNRNGI